MQKVNKTKDQHMHNERLLWCKCGLCDHHSKEICVRERCNCCDLEDMFSLLSQHEFYPRTTRTPADSALR